MTVLLTSVRLWNRCFINTFQTPGSLSVGDYAHYLFWGSIPHPSPCPSPNPTLCCPPTQGLEQSQ